jgi:hypothetical protein
VLKVALTPRYLELLAARLMAQAAYDKWIEDNQQDPLIVLDTGHDDAFPLFEKMNPASG